MEKHGTAFDIAASPVAKRPDDRQEVSRLLAVAGHDLKQPLSIAMMFLDLVRRDARGAKTPERLDRVYDALRQLCAELDALAAMSKSSDALGPHLQPVRIQELFDRLRTEWAAHTAFFGIDLRILPTSAIGFSDPAMLMTILRNLVSNAMKFSRPGGRVVVGCRSFRGNLRLEVHDGGLGIKKERLSTIFDAFDRGDHAEVAQGLGLGLFLVRQTATLLEHGLDIRSKEGEGTAFFVTLPKPALTS